MTNYQVLHGLDALGMLEALCVSKLLKKHILVCYRRYTRFLALLQAHPEEKRANMVVDASIELQVSLQTIYEDIRLMERAVEA